MLRSFCLIFMFALTACAATPPGYFPDETWPVEVGETYYRDQAGMALKLMNEPALAGTDSSPAFRMLMLTGVTPIHAVRVTPKDDGTARVVLHRLDSGYRTQGRRRNAFRKTRSASKEAYTTFLTALDGKDFFYDNAIIQTEDYQACLHPSLFIYEFRPQQQQTVVRENGCAHTEEGAEVRQAFYAIAQITPDKDSDWSLVDW